MIDLVDRLRFDAVRCEATFSKGVASNIEEAIAEIERLRGQRSEVQTARAIAQLGVAEVADAWTTLERHGFPPEAMGWPDRNLGGLLPEAIDNAIKALVQQREDLVAARTVAEGSWKCAARKHGAPGGNPPTDCDWPGCGCDPAANKVLEAIGEAGFEITKKGHAKPLQCLRCGTVDAFGSISRDSQLVAVLQKIQAIEAEARRYAGMYPQSSDGRNTFVMFADWVAGLAALPASSRSASGAEGSVSPLDWLAGHPNYELSFCGWDEDQVWELHSVNGGRNDREWTLLATGDTPEEALRKAMALSSAQKNSEAS